MSRHAKRTPNTNSTKNYSSKFSLANEFGVHFHSPTLVFCLFDIENNDTTTQNNLRFKLICTDMGGIGYENRDLVTKYTDKTKFVSIFQN